ncbi:hypothetical protein, partial [Sphingomonas sp. GB1N7]|uniref:hypothetical protein n=1 Tax=Parasphingomonas caseinilytica TaxID=3096158 RepID=UPI002FCBF560
MSDLTSLFGLGLDPIMVTLRVPTDRQISGKRQSLGIDCRDLATSQRVIDDGRREERQPDDAS